MAAKGFMNRFRIPNFLRFSQIKELCFRPKIRVVHKILSILSIMVLLIALQGYLNLGNINQIREINGKTFLESNGSLVSLMDAKQSITNFRRDCALFLATIAPFPPDVFTFVTSLSNVGISDRSKTDLDKLSQLMQQPLKKEQFQELNQLLVSIELDIDRLLNEAKEKSVKSMQLGNAFSDKSKNTTIIILIISGIVSVGLGLLVAASISRPLKKTVRMIQEMTQGHLGTRLNIKSRDEIGMMAQSMDRFADDLQNSLIGTMKQIAAGDLTAEIETQDERDEIGPALRSTIESLRRLVNDVNMLSQAAIEGRFEIRADAGCYEGDYRLIVEGINATLDIIVGGIDYQNNEVTRLAENLHRLAKGDLDLDLQVAAGDEHTRQARENFIRINQNLNQVKEALQGMVEDAGMLYQAAFEGKLDVRADASRHAGDYRKIIEGVNQTLDAVIVPLNEAIGVLSRMAVNDITVPMVGEYQGLLADFTDAINMVRNNLYSIQDLAVQVAQGDISQLDEYYQLGGKRSENDMLIPSFIRMMKTIQELVEEVNQLTKAATAGNLEVRGDVNKFDGLYRRVVEGVNRTLDSMAAPLGETIEVLNRMAENDYTCEMNRNYQGAFNQLSGAVNRVQKTLNEVLSEINQSAEQIANGSRQVADGSMQVSKGATTQASSIEELSATITQIATQTRENAVSANDANQLAIVAKEMAEQGNEQMKGMLKAISEIQNSSLSISKIIKVIDEIAFQTNILSLNAAIEAARAGQYGKGFAVVAEEVRNLAARSANAAKETTDMIENSIKKVKEGTNITETTATALSKIVEGVSRVTDLVGNIAVASKEQATGIAQINQGIEQVSRVVQTNTATAQESASTCQELSDQAEILKHMVNRFILKAEKQVKNELTKSETTLARAGSDHLDFGKY